MRGLGASIKILREKFRALGMGKHVGIKRIESARRHSVVVVPPHRLIREDIAHDIFVVWRTAGMGARFGAKGAALGNRGFAAPYCLFNKARGLEII